MKDQQLQPEISLSPLKSEQNPNDRRPFIKILVENILTEALLDSGANCTVISEEIAAQIDLDAVPKIYGPFEVKTADKTAHRFTEMYNLRYEFRGEVEMIPTVVLPQLGSKVILGMDFWDRFHITTSIQTLEVEETEPFCPVRHEHELNEIQRTALDEILAEMPFSQPGVIGKTHLLKHSIDTGDAQPIRRKAYIISPYMEEKVNAEVDRMLQLDAIEPAQSEWNNAMVIVKKPNGKIRYCIDARPLNAVTKRDAYPLPNLNRILSRLTRTRFLSSIDLSDAFWQVELEAADRPKTAFTVTGRGFFQFKRMPFGLVNSAATLCKLVDIVIGEDLEPRVFRYLDDFIIATDTFEEHLVMLQEVSKRLHRAGLTMSKEKSKFCMKQLKYVGYLIDEEGCRPDPEKTVAVMDYPVPTTIKELRRFYGMASWYRRFIRNFAEISAPLTELTRTKVKAAFQWNDLAQAAFEQLKECLTSAPVLAMPQYEGNWILETDASDLGMGGCLKQVQDGAEKTIVYFSKKFSKAAQKYTVTERECLAVITFIERSRPYIEGVPSFTVISDHASLRWLQNLKDPQGRLARWALRLQTYSYEIVHRPGAQMVVPDALSRAIAVIEITKEAKEADDQYTSLEREVIEEPAKHPMYKVHLGNLYKKNQSGDHDFNGSWKLVVPKSLQQDVIRDCHDEEYAGHGGIYRTLERVKRDYYWPKMAKTIFKYIKNCVICKVTKPANANQKPYMGKDRSPRKKFQMLCLDFIGPLPTSSKGNQWILVIIDNFTKYVVAWAIRKATSEKTIEILRDHVISKFGCPETIILDNGPQLRSKVFKEFAAQKRINLWYTPVYHPQANPTEAANHTLVKAIRAYIKDDKSHKRWDSNLQVVVSALNSSVHSATSVTPNMAVFGENLAITGNDHRARIIDSDDEDMPSGSRFEKIRTKVMQALEDAYDGRAKRYNLRARKREFQVGDVVMKRVFRLSNAANNYMAKLDHKFELVRIHEKLGSNCYKLIDTNGTVLPGTYSVQDLKA